MLSVREVDAADWPAIAARFHDLTFEQSLSYSSAAARRIAARTIYLSVMEEGALRAAVCLRIKTVPGFGRGIAWAAGGPMTNPKESPRSDPGEVLAALKAYVCDRCGHILRLRFPVSPGPEPEEIEAIAAGRGFYPAGQAARYETVMIDLRQSEEALMKGLHQKWRNALRNAQKKALEIEHGDFHDARLRARFEAVYDDVQQIKGFAPDIPPGFYETLEGPDFTHHILMARQGDRDVATMTLGQTGKGLVYLFGATSAQGRRLNAGYALMWQAILMGQAQGLSFFDLGGIDEETNPDVTRYKRRTGGREITAAGPFEARPSGPLPVLILAAETVRKRIGR